MTAVAWAVLRRTRHGTPCSCAHRAGHPWSALGSWSKLPPHARASARGRIQCPRAVGRWSGSMIPSTCHGGATIHAASRWHSSSNSMPASLTTSGQSCIPSSRASGEASAPGPSRTVLVSAEHSARSSDSSSWPPPRHRDRSLPAVRSSPRRGGSVARVNTGSLIVTHGRGLPDPGQADGRLLAAASGLWLRLLSAGPRLRLCTVLAQCVA